LSRAIVSKHPHFTRLSIDGILHDNHGLCGIDYPADLYSKYLDEADADFDRIFAELLDAAHDIVVDRSLYSKEDRDRHKREVEKRGARWVLVYFRPTSKDVIWERIRGRREAGINADSALDISRELLDKYWDGFDVPDGEGEIVVNVDN